MRRYQTAVIGVGVGLIIILVWFFLLWSPQGSSLSKAKQRSLDAERDRATLQDRINRLRAVQRDEPLKRSQLEALRVAIPDEPNLAQFILDTNDAANRAGIDFLSVTPTPPAAGRAPAAGASQPGAADSGSGSTAAGGTPPAMIALAINVTGGYLQVIDWLNRLSKLSRVVVIDNLTLNAGGGAGTGDTGGTSGAPAVGAGGAAPVLTVSIQARMFVSSATSVAGGTGAGGGAPGAATPGATTTTTPGATGGATTTTAPGGATATTGPGG